MPATNCTANTSRRHAFAFSNSGSTGLVNRIAALNFGLKGQTNEAKDEGVSGLLHYRAEDFVVDKTRVSGSVSFNVRPTDARWFLPIILGTAFSGNVIKAGAACPFFRVGHVDYVVQQMYTYIDCIVAKATFSSSDAAGGLLQVAMDIEATQETKAASTGWPTGLNLATSQPLVHSSSTLTVNGQVRRMKDAQIVIDNMVLADEFYNSRYRGDFPSDGQMIQLIHTTPFDDTNDVALTNLTGPIAAEVVYSSPTMSIAFSFPALKAIPAVPEVGGRNTRVTNQYTWEAVLAAGADPAVDSPLVITLDDTV